MESTRASIGTPCRIVSVIITVVFAAQLSSASPPRNGLPIPLYTLDSESPTIITGIANIHSDEILRKVDGNEYPVTEVLANGLNLGRPADDLDGISFNRIDVADLGSFILLFSVDRVTTGDVPPDPALVAQDVPFNVTDQVDERSRRRRWIRIGGIIRPKRGFIQGNAQWFSLFEHPGYQ